MQEFTPFVVVLIFMAGIAIIVRQNKYASQKLLKEGKLVQAVVVDDRAVSQCNSPIGLTYEFTDDKGHKRRRGWPR